MKQKFSKSLETIAGETTNDNKLPKTKARMKKQTQEQIMDEYKDYRKKPGKQIWSCIPRQQNRRAKTLRRIIIMLLMLLQWDHSALNKITAAAILFWWPKRSLNIQTK